jgi:CYTH domain-containing protein
MRKWNASMPRERAQDGMADVVIAFKKSTGQRAEFECALLAEDAEQIFKLAIEMTKKTKG